MGESLAGDALRGLAFGTGVVGVYSATTFVIDRQMCGVPGTLLKRL
jgi:hypothetical protein